MRNSEACYQLEWMYWSKQRGQVELGQPQSESELKIEHNKAIGTQHTAGSHIDSATFQVVMQ